MTEQLKPCPFCGGSAFVDNGPTNLWYVQCQECRIDGEIRSTKSEAITAWNCRAQPAQPGAEPVAVLRVYMERHDMGQSLEPNPAFQVEIARANMAAKTLPLGTYDLYTHPPARVPLTDEWIRERCQQTWVFETVNRWVREVEAAHGIGGGK